MAEGGMMGSQKNRRKKVDFMKKVPKLFDYLFLKAGIQQRGMALQSDGGVLLEEVLSDYPEYTEEQVYKALEEVDNYIIYQNESGQTCVKAKDDILTTDPSDCPDGTGSENTNSDQNERKNTPHHLATKQQRRNRERLKDDSEAVSLSSHNASEASDDLPRSQRKIKENLGVADVRLSKTLSWLLRHGAAQSGFRMQEGGFLYVTDALKLPQLKNFTETDVERVVATNAKQRFYMEHHPHNGRLRIRANQGHTMEISGLDLKPITSVADYPTVVHGTYFKAWDSIKTQGLSRMGRNHIHFAPGLPGESGVISGMRKNLDIFIYINLEKALQDGIPFFISANNVILTPGDENGFLSTNYFHEVLQRSPRRALSF